MNPLKKIKSYVKNRWQNNLSLAIYSVIIAIISWFVISMTQYPSTTKTFTNIPVSIDISGTSAAENDLTLISCDVTSVDVQILGSRTQIGNLTKDKLSARIVADNVTSAGTKTLAIEITSTDKDIDFQVKSKYPETASVVFDKYETREFSISPDIPNITFSEGKVVDSESFYCEPEKITITGPSAQLDKISKCVAVSNKSMNLDSSYTVTSDEIKLYSDDGATIEQSLLKFDTSSFIINIPVLTQKTVGLSVGIASAPSNFNTDMLDFTLSSDSITLASTTDQLSDFPDTFEVGKILLSDLDIGYSHTFTINTLDYKNLSNLQEVTVTLNDENLDSKEFNITNFNIINAPDGYDFDVITKMLEVKVVGDADVIEDITSNDIIADINLLNIKVPESDSFNWDVSISFPKYDNVWAVTQSKVVINKTAKTKTTSTESTEGE
jgi:hypothetical protein